MKFGEAYGTGKFGLSFEIFPPKTPAGEEALFTTVEALMAFRPSFITCTYGAGGSTREKTLELTVAIRERFGAPALRRASSLSDQRRPSPTAGPDCPAS